MYVHNLSGTTKQLFTAIDTEVTVCRVEVMYRSMFTVNVCVSGVVQETIHPTSVCKRVHPRLAEIKKERVLVKHIHNHL